MDEFDRILSAERQIEPSAAFAADVMHAVASQGQAPPPIPFPWARVLSGIAACGVLAWAGMGAGIASDATTWQPVVEAVAPAAPALGYAAVTLCLVLGGLRLHVALAAAD